MKFSYNSRRWRFVRAQVIARDERKCRECGKRWGRFEVDHIVSLKRGGAEYDQNNLQTLCAFPCHNEKTSRENRGSSIVGRAAWLERIDKLCR